MIALFTTEAESVELTEVVKEAIWLRVLVSNLNLVQCVTPVFCASQSVIDLLKNQVSHEPSILMLGITSF